MNKEEKIIRYIENELTSEERIAFENELKFSAELRNEFEKFLSLKNETNDLKEIKLNNIYLDSVLTEFRNKIQTSKAHTIKSNLRYSFAIMIIFLFSTAIVYYFLPNKPESTDLTEFTKSLNNSQRIDLLEDIDDGFVPLELISENDSINEIDELLNVELVINNSVLESYDIAYDDLIAGLERDEINRIYNEILNRNF